MRISRASRYVWHEGRGLLGCSKTEGSQDHPDILLSVIESWWCLAHPVPKPAAGDSDAAEHAFSWTSRGRRMVSLLPCLQHR